MAVLLEFHQGGKYSRIEGWQRSSYVLKTGTSKDFSSSARQAVSCHVGKKQKWYNKTNHDTTVRFANWTLGLIILFWYGLWANIKFKIIVLWVVWEIFNISGNWTVAVTEN